MYVNYFGVLVYSDYSDYEDLLVFIKKIQVAFTCGKNIPNLEFLLHSLLFSYAGKAHTHTHTNKRTHIGSNRKIII